MKKVLFLLAALFASLAICGQELKGITLGSYTKITSASPKIVTLVGRDYALATINLKSGKCVAIIAVPISSNVKYTRRVKLVEADNLASGLTDKYGVEFESYLNEDTMDGTLEGIKGDLHIILYFEKYDESDGSYAMSMIFRSVKLQEAYQNELKKDL